MAAYVVMEKEGTRAGAAGATVFVRDGFHWPALFVPVVWLLWHRLWIEAALALGVTMLLTAAGEIFGFGLYASLLALLVSVFFALEGAALRIRAMTRRGWQERAVVAAPRLADAELIYFGTRGAEAEGEADAGQVIAQAFSAPARLRMQPAPHAIGLVPYPGRT